MTSKAAAQRWGESRERELLVNGQEKSRKDVPTLETFAPRFLDGHARANRQKPGGIAHKEVILRVHLIPRHTFCSHLAMRGAPVRAIQELAGHRDLATTQRYRHLSSNAISDAIRLLEAHGPFKSPHSASGDIVETGS